MRKINEKVDKPDTDNGFINDISSLFKKKKTNIIAQSVVSVWFIHFSAYFPHLVKFTKIDRFSISE